jgi:hypothetical protein
MKSEEVKQLTTRAIEELSTALSAGRTEAHRGIDALSGGDESLSPLQLAQRDAHHAAKTYSDAPSAGSVSLMLP